MFSLRAILFRCLALAGTLVASAPALAQYVPDRLFFRPYATEGIPGSTLTVNGAPATAGENPLANPFVLEETDIFASSPPAGEPGGQFERNSHLARFASDSEIVPGNPNRFGHQFQRSEAWDIAFDLKIEADANKPRKEAGFFFENVAVGEAMFIATSNAALYEPGPGEITTVFLNVIPPHSFATSAGPLGDYDGNGSVDTGDYNVWRDTLGSTTDFRANGDNSGASEDLIDQADYDVWAKNYGMGGGGDLEYNVGDTLRMRMIYTPPVLDPGTPFDPGNPGANVTTAGKMEYIISLNGGPTMTSGPLDFENAWKGLPNDTFISARVQNLSTLSAAPDESKVTFSNWDFNGDLPGSGTGAGLVAASAVPEPATGGLLAVAGIWLLGIGRRVRVNRLY